MGTGDFRPAPRPLPRRTCATYAYTACACTRVRDRHDQVLTLTILNHVTYFHVLKLAASAMVPRPVLTEPEP